MSQNSNEADTCACELKWDLIDPYAEITKKCSQPNNRMSVNWPTPEGSSQNCLCTCYPSKPAGKFCSSDGDCESQRCACIDKDEARCAPIQTGGYCSKNDDCASGDCKGIFLPWVTVDCQGKCQ